VLSEDGTPIAYHSLGHGPGLVVVGGVLSSASDYFQLARALAGDFEVHVMERRGRPGSGPQREDHDLGAECDDLAAVATATESAAVFGHSFGGLVALETARRRTTFDELFLYEPAVPLRGQLSIGWLREYEQLLDRGSRRGAFAWMVKHAGHAPGPISTMPMWCVRLVLRLGIRGEKWAAQDRLLEENAVEHRILGEVEAPTAERFSTVTARTVLLGGAKSPPSASRALLGELVEVIPHASLAVLPGLRHSAPQDRAAHIAAAVLANRRVSPPPDLGPPGGKGLSAAPSFSPYGSAKPDRG
jgi:pimeloyl-ACP methyl ester carboxylesterase